ncbi:MAG: PAS domain S-box protein [Bacteroidetes bacterium]|jgi:PAS domain S-box-containing protein|nr:PAS domain S-box protein [Bacteroidota bacterium]
MATNASLSHQSPAAPAPSQEKRLYEEAPVPYVIGLPDGRIKSVNKAAAARLGYAREELKGQPVHLLYADTPKGKARARVSLRKLQEGAARIEDEVQMQTKAGEVFWARTTVRTIRDAEDAVIAHWGVFIDITEQKGMEQALRKERAASEEEVQRRTAALREANAALRAEVEERRQAEEGRQKQLAAMEASIVGMSIHDAEGRFTYANPAYKDIYGYAPDEIKGEPWKLLYEDDRIAHIEAEVLPRLQEEDQWTGELRGRTKAGNAVDTLISLTPLSDGGLACIAQDITEQKRQECALQQYANRLETLHEIDRAILAAESPQAIADAALQRCTEQLPCMRASIVVFDHGTGEGEILGSVAEGESRLEAGKRYPIEAFHITERLQQGRAEVVNDLSAVDATPVLQRLQDEGIRSYISLPMLLDSRLIGLINLGDDVQDVFTEDYQDLMREVTDQVAIAIRQARLLERVQHQAEVLEQRVAERTAELESFTYSVSHDLRSPLRAIDGFSRLLDQEYGDLLDDEGQRLLSVIRTSASRMGQLIDDLLALSRLGRQDMRTVPIDMEELACSVVEELRRIHDDHDDAAVTIDIEALPDATGDPAMVRTILTNLLSNSLKFSREEEAPRIVVGAEVHDGTPVYYVRDNGAGFDMTYADKLFGVFQRLHDDEDFEGTGVGLAIVHRAIARHGGRIWAESTVGDGATFYFALDDVPESTTV